MLSLGLLTVSNWMSRSIWYVLAQYTHWSTSIFPIRQLPKNKWHDLIERPILQEYMAHLFFLSLYMLQFFSQSDDSSGLLPTSDQLFSCSVFRAFYSLFVGNHGRACYTWSYWKGKFIYCFKSSTPADRDMGIWGITLLQISTRDPRWVGVATFATQLRAWQPQAPGIFQENGNFPGALHWRSKHRSQDVRERWNHKLPEGNICPLPKLIVLVPAISQVLIYM